MISSSANVGVEVGFGAGFDSDSASEFRRRIEETDLELIVHCVRLFPE